MHRRRACGLCLGDDDDNDGGGRFLRAAFADLSSPRFNRKTHARAVGRATAGTAHALYAGRQCGVYCVLCVVCRVCAQGG